MKKKISINFNKIYNLSLKIACLRLSLKKCPKNC